MRPAPRPASSLPPRRAPVTGLWPGPSRQNSSPEIAHRDATQAQAAAEAACTGAGRIRTDAEKMLAGFRAEAARDRDELRADLRGPGRAHRVGR